MVLVAVEEVEEPDSSRDSQRSCTLETWPIGYENGEISCCYIFGKQLISIGISVRRYIYRVLYTHVHGLVAGCDLRTQRCVVSNGLFAGDIVDLEWYKGILAVSHVVEPLFRGAPAGAIFSTHEVQCQLARAGHGDSAA